MLWIGVAIVLVTFYFIVKNYEARIVLALSGVAMAIVAGSLGGLVPAFSKMLSNSSLVPIIVTTLGFGYLINYTGCTTHLVSFITRWLTKVRFLVVPGALVATFIINISLNSASGVGAAVGALLIPTLVGLGVHPATAAAAILLGTYGNVLNPGQAYNVQVAKLAGTETTTVVSTFLPVIIASVAASIVLLLVMDRLLSKKGTVTNSAGAQATTAKLIEKPNIIFALIPMLPIILLLLGANGIIPAVDVTTAMMIGTVAAMLTKVKDLQGASKEFFRGMGNSFGDIIGLMGAAAMFTYGLEVVGIIDALIEVMSNSQAIAKYAAGFGPLAIAALSGSGNAAAIAFNESITPHAASFGYGIAEMGSVAQIAAQLGRTMSPVAGVTILLARLADVSPMDLVKRTTLPMVVAVLLLIFVLL